MVSFFATYACIFESSILIQFNTTKKVITIPIETVNTNNMFLFYSYNSKLNKVKSKPIFSSAVKLQKFFFLNMASSYKYVRKIVYNGQLHTKRNSFSTLAVLNNVQNMSRTVLFAYLFLWQLLELHILVWQLVILEIVTINYAICCAKICLNRVYVLNLEKSF